MGRFTTQHTTQNNRKNYSKTFNVHQFTSLSLICILFEVWWMMHHASRITVSLSHSSLQSPVPRSQVPSPQSAVIISTLNLKHFSLYTTVYLYGTDRRKSEMRYARRTYSLQFGSVKQYLVPVRRKVYCSLGSQFTRSHDRYPIPGIRYRIIDNRSIDPWSMLNDQSLSSLAS